jgi:peptide/nickel transport system ATP-binding protein
MTEAPAQPALEIESLSIALPEGADRSLAVENVSLKLAPREILCVVGESGSGKSVMLFAIMGLLTSMLRTAQGSIRFFGRNILSLSSAEMRELRGNQLAMIFQEPMTALNPTMAIGRQIEETLRIHTQMDRTLRRARAIELMRLVNIPSPESLIARYPHQISGGQRQRVMIAMALALEPAVLLADEPTTALDVTTQAQILKQIREIQRRSNTAVLLVTHDIGVVAEIADRIIVMQSGKIVEQGSTQDVLQAPQHPYTQSLLAAVPGIRHRRPRQPTAGAPEILKVVDLSKSYPSAGFWRRGPVRAPAVDHVNLVVRQGETLSVVGESGSGKSTMARCICGLLNINHGTIAIDGINQEPEKRTGAQPVQLIFQDPNRSLDPRWTVGKSMVEGMCNIGKPRADALERAGDLLEKVGLQRSALNRHPHEFSGGQRQRICIARALSMEPRLLIADEAVSALDVSVQAQVLALLAKLQEEMQLGLLFITHDLRTAVQISDHIAVMHNGNIVEYGPALDVFSNPQHAYSRQLFEASPGRRWLP